MEKTPFIIGKSTIILGYFGPISIEIGRLPGIDENIWDGKANTSPIARTVRSEVAFVGRCGTAALPRWSKS